MRRLAAVLLLAAGVAGCGVHPEAELAQGLRVLAAPQPDARAASVLLRRAAQAGSARGAFHLALLLRNGADGVTVDHAQAFAWMQRAAQGGLPRAQFLLGQMLLAGEGAAHDATQARYWFEQAAEHDLPEANLELAMAGQRGDWGITPEETARYMMEAQHAQKHRPPEP
ncbi:sel1 repeat family protein [Ramlibacter sp. G-1-2-2]|uniref:Sel1 repeat family protein n=1 Tax=Ramlibacter agri TaxID=2728837 RepID=A0A848H0P7_9BURK|nr:tetratricopeptide repeat protein [Ramlibacter agri]NML43109.1 sel1 repeat family protein [Ramlibacter agri]